jgi:two-component sensor histidine kinase
VLNNLLAAYQSPDSPRVRKSGVDLSIDDRSATPLALLFHELATNAAKYGALASEHGRIEISVTLSEGYATIVWVEMGGPEIPLAPVKVGFGSTLVKLSVDKQLGGSIRHEWLSGGLRATIMIPEAALSRKDAKSELHP